MPLINFQGRWADAVELGACHAQQPIETAEYLRRRFGDILPKRTTIRKPGRAKPGDTLYLYTGLRTKQARRLGVTLCLAVTPLSVYRDPHQGTPILFLADRLLADAQAEQLARLDTAGLWSWAELAGFLETSYGLPFEGELICW